jgi:hypothetical protein
VDQPGVGSASLPSERQPRRDETFEDDLWSHDHMSVRMQSHLSYRQFVGDHGLQKEMDHHCIIPEFTISVTRPTTGS